jgi:two-component system chemotaxis sensor kinase CheA
MGHTKVRSSKLLSPAGGVVEKDEAAEESVVVATLEGEVDVSEPVPGMSVEMVLETIGEKLVFLDVRDLHGLAELHTDFQEVANLVADMDGVAELGEVAAVAITLISVIILEESDDPQRILDTLGDIVDFMRSALRQGKVPPLPARWSQEGSTAEVTVGEEASPVAEDGNDLESARETAHHDLAEVEVVDSFCGDPELLNEFLQEAREHLEQADIHLLTLEAEPENAEAISAVFRAFHTVKGGAGLLQMRAIQSLSHVAESLLDKVRQGNIRMEGPVIDLCFEAADGLKQLVEDQQEVLGSGAPPRATEWIADLVARLEALTRQGKPVQRMGEILVESGVASRESIAQALEVQADSDPPRKLGEVLVSSGAVTARDTVDALRKQQEQRRPVLQVRESIKVDADRLDLLVDLIGELVIAEAMVSQTPMDQDDSVALLGRRLGHMDKITRELQSISMSLRMVPVRGTFQKMARLVRDLAKKEGKEVEFITEGDDTELDKNVVDLVADPLMHMVRNSVDHGIESAEARKLTGKPRVAKVILRAYHEGGGIYIDIVDDGHGLDRKAILAKALERGLVQPGEEPSDNEVWNLIFQPGFSTAKEITDVSGRGVGMDVVQRNISALHGRIDIRSEAGVGSTFSIRLPLTLAIIDGMAIKVGEERFIIPIGSVVRATRPQPGEVHTINASGEVLHQHDQLIPLFRLHELMSIPNAIQDPECGIVLILDDSGRRVAILADDLIGQQQVVIKPLGKGLGSVPGLAGGAIMPDGRVGLILDTASLFNSARNAGKGGQL